MRNFVTLILCLSLLMSCDVDPEAKVTSEQARNHIPESFIDCSGWTTIWVETYKDIGGMRYLFITNYNGGSMQINITKDQLECEYYRKLLNDSNKH